MNRAPRRITWLGALLLAVCLPDGQASSGHETEALVAVATNFVDAASAVTALLERETGYRVVLSAGSTGKLFAQIRSGAPYAAFLAADQLRPRLLEARGDAVPGSRFTYAVGRLVLWSRDPNRIGDDPIGDLRAGEFRALAMANPALAPYGSAAREVLERLGLHVRLADRVVLGENVGQAFALVATGNAELGFVALATLRSPRHHDTGSRWEVPATLHAPIRQDAVLLRQGAGNPAAIAFLDLLRQPDAQALLEAYGYTGG